MRALPIVARQPPPGRSPRQLPEDVAPDQYGDGGAVAELEAEVASSLGKPAAAFLPSGTMAQQSALRIHADARGRQVVLFHPPATSITMRAAAAGGCTTSSAGRSATSFG